MLSLLKVYLSQKIPGNFLPPVAAEFLNKHASEFNLESVNKDVLLVTDNSGIGCTSQRSPNIYITRVFE
jgi:hypothetical protein